MPFSRLFKRREHNMPIIDGIRALAILWVICFHAWIIQVLDMPTFVVKIFDYPFLKWLDKGDLGVDLFFVISGFLIGSIIFKEIKSTGTFIFRQFYFRRYMRIMPVYIFAILLNLYFTGNYNIGHYWSNILFVNNYIPGTEMIWTWSLAIEEQFYLIAPLIFLFLFPLFKNRWHFFLVLALLSIGFNAYYVFFKMNLTLPFNVAFPTEEWFNWFNNYYRVSHLRFVGLLSGLAAAYAHIYQADRIKDLFQNKAKLLKPLTFGILMVLIIISFTPMGEWLVLPHSMFTTLPVGVGQWYAVLDKAVFSFGVAYLIIACLYATGTWMNPLKWFLSLRLFYPIAQLSYSMYLVHVMWMFWIFPKLFTMWSATMSPTSLFFARYIIGIGGTFAIAIITYYLVEQPFMKLRNKVKFKKLTYKGITLGPA
jgi:peptidoglycan/LPS O-acetylase OafA/YrhL